MPAAFRSNVLCAATALVWLLTGPVPAIAASEGCVHLEQQIADTLLTVTESRDQNHALRLQLTEQRAVLDRVTRELDGIKAETGYDERSGIERLASWEVTPTATSTPEAPTRIEVNEAQGVIRFFINGREILRADAKGITVDGAVITKPTRSDESSGGIPADPPAPENVP